MNLEEPISGARVFPFALKKHFACSHHLVMIMHPSRAFPLVWKGRRCPRTFFSTSRYFV